MIDILILIAEFSVTIAGFTAVFSVLDRRQSGDSREMTLQVLRVKQMLLGSVTTSLTCVVALAMLRAGVAEPTVWRTAAGAALVVLLSCIVSIGAEGKREKVFGAPSYSRTHATVVFTLLGIDVVLLAWTVVAAGQEYAPALFTAAMITTFTFSFLQFARAAIKQFAAARFGGAEQ
jgi:hypothetical protein